MIHFEGSHNIYFDESLWGFTKQLTDDGVVKRQVDLVLIGAAYAIRNGLAPLEHFKRHDLIRVASLDPDLQLALAASLAWYAREQQLDPPKAPKDLLDLLARAGSAGLSRLKEEWETLSPGQLRLRLLRLTTHSS